MPALLTAVTEFVEAIRGQAVSVEDLNDRSRRVAERLPRSRPADMDAALRLFVGLFPNVPLAAVGLVALNCGSLVENGGDPSIAGPVLLAKLPRLNETATEFYSRCRALAEADRAFLDEVRAEAIDPSEEAGEDREWTPADLVAEHVANEGWEKLADRYGPAIYQGHPTAVLGHMSEEVFRLGLIAHLSRSKALRAAARARPELLAQTQAADAAAGLPYSFLTTMLRVLDDELLTVIHVGQRKGFDVRIAGLADNFQLHVLLAGALIGKPSDGWLDGERPSPRAVAECRDRPVGKAGGANVTGAFNLLNWTALQPDGTLANGSSEDPDVHWIWNEGCPADIVPFEGRRVVLLGPPPYSRHWRAGRQFDGMTGELEVERKLSTAEVAAWLARLQAAGR
jgi:hypothetical protein